MKISPEDPILTAYALGELDESSRASVEAAFAKDEALALEGAKIASLAGFMSETLQGESFSLGDERRDEILKAGRLPDADVLVLDHRRRSRRQSLLALVGVAAVVVAGFVGLSKLGTSGPSASGSGEAASGADFPKVEGLGGETSEVTLQSGHSVKAVDPSFVERTLNEKGDLPERDRFQLAEWINAGALSSEPLLTVNNIGAYAELGPCSWDERKSLLLVNLRSLDGKKASVKAKLNFNSERVKSSTLLGSVKSATDGELQTGVMESEQSCLYELDLLPGEGQVGSLDLDVADEAAGYLPLSNASRENLSDDFVMARVFAEFAQWGKSEARDPEALRATATSARSLLGRVTDEKARYALDMILLAEESLKK